MQLVSVQDDDIELGLVSPFVPLLDPKYYDWLDNHFPTRRAGRPTLVLGEMGYFSSITDLGILASPVTVNVNVNGQSGTSRAASPTANGGQSGDFNAASPWTEVGRLHDFNTTSPVASGGQSHGPRTASSPGNQESPFADKEAAEARFSLNDNNLRPTLSVARSSFEVT